MDFPLTKIWSTGCKPTRPFCVPCTSALRKPVSRLWSSSRFSDAWTTTPYCSDNRSISRSTAADRPFYSVNNGGKEEGGGAEGSVRPQKRRGGDNGDDVGSGGVGGDGVGDSRRGRTLAVLKINSDFAITDSGGLQRRVHARARVCVRVCAGVFAVIVCVFAYKFGGGEGTTLYLID